MLLAAIGLAVLGWHLLSPQGTREGWSVLRPPYDVNALALFDGRILAGGRDGLIALDPETGAPLEPLPDTPPMTYAKAILVDEVGRLWVGYRTGLARYDHNGWVEIPVSPGTQPGPITAMIELAGGGILVGGEAGLAMVEGEGFVPLSLPADRVTSAASALLEDANGRLWVGFSSPTRGGLLLRDEAGWHEIRPEDGLIHPSVNQIIEDSTGRIHVAAGFSGRGGVCHLDDPGNLTSWNCLGMAEGLASDMVRLVFEDSYGQIWYGSEFRGAAVLGEGHMVRLGLEDGLAGSELKAMLEDPSGALWLGCDKGLTRISGTAAMLTDVASEEQK